MMGVGSEIRQVGDIIDVFDFQTPLLLYNPPNSRDVDSVPSNEVLRVFFFLLSHSSILPGNSTRFC